MRVLVTGATGFVGRTLIPTLEAAGHSVVAAVRSPIDLSVPTITVGEIDGNTDWSLQGIDAIVHLAGRAHQLKDRAENPALEFDRVNASGTARLVSAASTLGVRRFLFMSTIGVHGTSTAPGEAITERSQLRPEEPYAVSKLTGEEAVTSAGVSYTIIRPPLVYGAGAPGNLRTLCGALSKGWPMPLANARGERSMVSVRNLCSFIARCLGPGAEDQTFVISEEKPFRTCDLARELSLALGKRPLFYPVPVDALCSLAKHVGRGRLADRLFGSLVVDSSYARTQLAWTSPFDPKEDLIAMGKEFARS